MSPSRLRSRHGFTLIEMLVVLAILVILAAMLFQGLQQVRDSAARAKCGYTMHLLGIATQGLHDKNSALPPMAAPDSNTATSVPGPYAGAVGFTVFDWLLPEVDERQVYDKANVLGKYNVNANIPNAPPTNSLLSWPVNAYHCPAEPSKNGINGPGLANTMNGGANQWAYGNYAANYNVFGNPENNSGGPLSEGNRKIPGGFPDGVSRTIMYTERYGTCGNAGGTHANIWSQSNANWRPVFCVNNVSQVPGGPGYTVCNIFQVKPDWSKTCNSAAAQSPHARGINTCMADSSVRFILGSIAPGLWASLCDPQDRGPSGDAGW
jgi:prepilin-type N-terminal cleavage/methylation domain-containing protein